MAAIDWKRNSLLAMLPAAVTDRIGERLEIVAARAGDVLIDSGEHIDKVYFPLDLVVSLDQIVVAGSDEPGAAPGVALTGSEGVVGMEPFFGSDTSVNRATVRIAGHAVRVDCGALRDEFIRAGAFHRLLLRWADALIAQLAGVAACERVHPVQQRLIRWLLSFDDRVPLRDLGLTQESLAQLLGVRRVSVSAAASQLQETGFIAYKRGHVMIVDRAGLAGRACKCYGDIRARYEAYLEPD